MVTIGTSSQEISPRTVNRPTPHVRTAVLVAALLLFAIGLATAAHARAAIPGKGVLPDNRGWELVSPQDKGGLDVAGYGFRASSTLAGGNGETLSYAAAGAFPGLSTGSHLPNVYLAERHENGWANSSLLPPFDSTTLYVGGEGAGLTSRLHALSSDQAHGIVSTTTSLTAQTPVPVDNFYRQGKPGPDYELLTPNGPEPLDVLMSSGNLASFDWATEDLSRMYFSSNFPWTDDAPSGGRKLYESIDGSIRLVSIDENETPISATPTNAIAEIGSARAASTTRGVGQHPVSEDGRVVYFELGGDGAGNGAFVRVDGTTTHRLPSPFAAGTPDGSRALLISGEFLDAETGEVEAGPPVPGQILLASEQLDYVYSTSATEEVPGQDPLPADGKGLYLSRNGVTTLVVPMGPATSNASTDPIDSSLDTLKLGNPYHARSDDGTKLVFTTSRSVGDIPVDGHYQTYLYDADVDETVCISCPGGEAADTDSSLWGTGNPGIYFSPYETQLAPGRSNISADGERVFFQTGDALVPHDRNGRVDTYIWQNGEAELLSNGSGQYGGRFLDASEDGNDAFFVTRDRLSGKDSDNLVDVYDARVDGGFPEPPPEPAECSGAGCQEIPERPRPMTPATAENNSAGNPSPQRNCKRLRSRARSKAARSRKLNRKASRASGVKAKRLRKRARKARRKSRTLERKVRNCRKELS